MTVLNFHRRNKVKKQIENGEVEVPVNEEKECVLHPTQILVDGKSVIRRLMKLEEVVTKQAAKIKALSEATDKNSARCDSVIHRQKQYDKDISALKGNTANQGSTNNEAENGKLRAEVDVVKKQMAEHLHDVHGRTCLPMKG